MSGYFLDGDVGTEFQQFTHQPLQPAPNGLTKLFTTPAGFMTKLVALSLRLVFDVGALVPRFTYYQISDPSGGALFYFLDNAPQSGGPGSAPAPHVFDSFSLGAGLSGELFPAAGFNDQYDTNSLPDVWLPDGFTISIGTANYQGGDSIDQIVGAYYIREQSRAPFNLPIPPNDSKALAYLLHQP